MHIKSDSRSKCRCGIGPKQARLIELSFLSLAMCVTMMICFQLKGFQNMMTSLAYSGDVASPSNDSGHKVLTNMDSSASRSEGSPQTKDRNAFRGTSSDRSANLPKAQDQISNGRNGTFCVGWDKNMDSWWTHHPDWFVSMEDKNRQCFSPMKDKKKAAFFKRLYKIQFKSDCSKVKSKEMWSSGYGADMLNVDDGLVYALERKRPFQIALVDPSWHYAARRDGSHAVCPSKDMFCYFLNISSCEPSEDVDERDWISKYGTSIDTTEGAWVDEFASRQQTWLRHEIFKYSSSVNLTTPCTALHVRRTDVVLHDDVARKYHAIKEYIDAGKDSISKNLLLLTDDQNAIDEATSLFPEYNWMYLDRPRFRAAEGGWENQTPSNDPKKELIIILSIFQLAKRCHTLVHSHSNFADYIYKGMDDANRINLDDVENDPESVFNEDNSQTVNISRSDW